MTNTLNPTTLRAPREQYTVFVGLTSALDTVASYTLTALLGAKYGVVVADGDRVLVDLHSFDKASTALEVAQELADELGAIKICLKGNSGAYTAESYQAIARANGLSLTRQDCGEYRCTLSLARAMAAFPSLSRAEVVSRCEDIAIYDDIESALRSGLFINY